MKEEWKVFIRGNKDRGEEVIKTLTDLGGRNYDLNGTNNDSLYFINPDGIIYCTCFGSEIAKIIMYNYREIKLPERWKDGDILINNDGTYYKVVSDYDPDNANIFYAYNMSISVEGTITQFHDGVWTCSQKDYRLATPSEVERFYDLLHAFNKDWDAEKKEIVNMKWKPKDGETYWVIDTEGYVRTYTWDEDPTDDNCFDFGNCFQTKEEAMIAAEKIKRLLKEE